MQVAGHNLVNSTAGLHKHDAFGKELIIKTGGGERWEKSTWHLLGTVLPSPHHRHLCDKLLPSPITYFQQPIPNMLGLLFKSLLSNVHILYRKENDKKKKDF